MVWYVTWGVSHAMISCLAELVAFDVELEIYVYVSLVGPDLQDGTPYICPISYHLSYGWTMGPYFFLYHPYLACWHHPTVGMVKCSLIFEANVREEDKESIAHQTLDS